MAQKLHRVQKIVLPILRAEIPDTEFTTWGADIDYREFPFVNIRRVGGPRHPKHKLYGMPVIEMSAYTDVDLPTTEELYEDCLDALYDAVKAQTRTDFGYLSRIKETMGATQFSSLYADSWRIQGLIALGISPLR